MKVFRAFVLVLSFIWLLGCEEEDVHPDIKTVSITPTSAVTFTVKGNFVETGNIPIEAFGFVFGSGSQPILDLDYGNTVNLGKTPNKGGFEAQIFYPSYSYYERVYARAFITNARGTAYGNVVSVEVPRLSVSTVSPLTAKTGEEIVITGNNFSADKSLNIVMFNNTAGTVTEAQQNRLVVVVPANIGCSYYCYDSFVDVEVRVGNQSVQATDGFVVKPSVTNMQPTTGTFGTQVTIEGSFRPSNGYYNVYQVYVGNELINVNSVSASAITFTIPNAVNTPSPAIKLLYGGNVYDVGQFTMEPPSISSISCTRASVGSNVSINGSGFNPGYYYSNYNSVKIGNQAAYVTGWSASKIEFVVPSLTAGSYTIEVSNTASSIVYPEPFVVADLVVSSLSANQARPGDVVRINGEFAMCNNNPEVLLWGNSMPIIEVSESHIDFQIPSSWYTFGSSTLELRIGSAWKVISSEFLVASEPPVITDISCKEVFSGSYVTITGSNFNPVSYSSVKIGDQYAYIYEYSSSSSRIDFLVPNLSPGNYPIEVFNYGNSVIYSDSLVIASIVVTSLSSNSVRIGGTFTVNGDFVNCDFTPEAFANGTYLQPLSWNGTQITFLVPTNFWVGTFELYLRIGTETISVSSNFTISP